MTTEQICKRICTIRFVDAVLYSSALQIVLLTIFLLLMNMSIFHPIRWITETISFLLSFWTFLCVIPLIAAVILYGICLGKQYLHISHYYPTRAVLIYRTTFTNFMFLAVHILFGFVTAWMYSKYFVKWNETSCGQNRYCVQENSLISILNGMYVSCYYYIVRGEVDTSFFIIQQNVYIKVRSKLVTILANSLIQSIGPLFIYLLLYVVLGSSIKCFIASTFNLEFQEASLFTFKQIFFLWMLSSHILCNIVSVRQLFKIFLEKYTPFNINENEIQNSSTTVTLTQALSSNITSIRKLASYDLFTLANGSDVKRRAQIFSLSMPGGHPYNWNTLSSTCLQQIDSYYDALSKSIERIASENKSNRNPLYRPKSIVGIAFADKTRFRQYNQNYGIRNMSTTNGNCSAVENPTCQQLDDVATKFKSKLKNVKEYVLNLPGVNYLFGEEITTKIDFDLQDTETISWICQGLSSLAAQSLKEDKYGVVHNNLVKIMTSLLKLKKVVDKIYDIRLDNKVTQLNCVHLRNTLGRCLFQLCSTFEEYLSDLITDPNELQYFLSVPRNPEQISFS